MQQFFIKYKEWLIVFLLIYLLGFFFQPVALLLTALLFPYFVYKKQEVYVLFFLFFILVLSDNYSMKFAAQIKPLLILLVAILVTLQKEVLKQGSLIKPFMFFFFVSLFSIHRSPVLITAFMKNLSYFLLFLSIPPLTIHVLKTKGRKVALDFISIGVVVLIIGFIYLIINPHFAFSHGGRFKGIFGNPNGLGIFSFLLFCFLTITKKHLGVKIDKWQNIIYLVIILMSLFYSKSRGAMAATLIFVMSQSLSKISIVLPLIIVPLLGVYLDFILNMALLILEQMGLGKVFRVDGKESIEKASGRAVAWHFAWIEIQKNFYFGKGWAYDEYWIYGPIQKKIKHVKPSRRSTQFIFNTLAKYGISWSNGFCNRTYCNS